MDRMTRRITPYHAVSSVSCRIIDTDDTPAKGDGEAYHGGGISPEGLPPNDTSRQRPNFRLEVRK